MDLVHRRRPQLFDETTRLRSEHVEFRQLLRHILQALDEMGNAQATGVVEEERFYGICHKLHDLLDRLDEHDAKEISLLEQVLIDAAASPIA